jgi:hypothetical protein
MNENLENKKANYEELAKKITNKYKNEMKSIKGLIKVIENNSIIEESDTIEINIFKKYLELENVQKVANYINDLGYRIKTNSYAGERKYTGNDISNIIASNVKVEAKLKTTVQDLHSQNSIAMARKYN